MLHTVSRRWRPSAGPACPGRLPAVSNWQGLRPHLCLSLHACCFIATRLLENGSLAQGLSAASSPARVWRLQLLQLLPLLETPFGAELTR